MCLWCRSGCSFTVIWTCVIIFLGSGNARLNLLFVFPYQSINAAGFFKPSALPHKPGLFLDVYAWLSSSGLRLTTAFFHLNVWINVWILDLLEDVWRNRSNALLYIGHGLLVWHVCYLEKNLILTCLKLLQVNLYASQRWETFPNFFPPAV